jgi:transcriptional regulator with XRE-family HTH domain
MNNAGLTANYSDAPTTTPVDRHVGRRLRGKRRALGLAEHDLASALGVDVGTIRAYERATARVPAEHLVRLGEFMDVALGYFFPTTPCPRP